MSVMLYLASLQQLLSYGYYDLPLISLPIGHIPHSQLEWIDKEDCDWRKAKYRGCFIHEDQRMPLCKNAMLNGIVLIVFSGYRLFGDNKVKRDSQGGNLTKAKVIVKKSSSSRSVKRKRKIAEIVNLTYYSCTSISCKCIYSQCNIHTSWQGIKWKHEMSDLERKAGRSSGLLDYRSEGEPIIWRPL